MMVATFCGARLVPGQIFVLQAAWQHRAEVKLVPPGLQVIVPFAWLATLCLNSMWFYRMVKGVIKVSVFLPWQKRRL